MDYFKLYKSEKKVIWATYFIENVNKRQAKAMLKAANSLSDFKDQYT